MARNTLAGKSTGKSKSAKYIFTYQTKCIINGKTYIGVHTTNNIDDGYIGNGIYSKGGAETRRRHADKPPAFVLAVCKYGYENFEREILSFFDDEESAYEEEAWLVDKAWVLNGGNYNLALGGRGSNRVPVYDHLHDEIYDLYAKGFRYKDIAYLFNCSISEVNRSLCRSKGAGKPTFKRRGVRRIEPTVVDKNKTEVLNRKINNQIVVFNNGEHKLFSSIVLAAEYLGVSDSTARKYMVEKLLLNDFAIVKYHDFDDSIDYQELYKTRFTKTDYTGCVLEYITGELDTVKNSKDFAKKHALDERGVSALLSGKGAGGYKKHRVGWWYLPGSDKLIEDRMVYLPKLKSPDGEVIRLIDVYDPIEKFKKFRDENNITVWELLKQVALGKRLEYKGYRLCQ